MEWFPTSKVLATEVDVVMNDFTPTQGRYLAFILAYFEAFGESPSDSEIAEALKVAGPSVNQMMKTLAGKGLIRRQAGVPRSIEFLVDAESIPKWTGKRPTRVVMQWVQTHPPETEVKSKAPARSQQTVYRFKVVLNGIRPPIWRRIEVLNISLAKFHLAIQGAMGWTNSHRHMFQIGEMFYTDPELMDDFGSPYERSYSGLKVSDLVEYLEPKCRFTYMYDFGDGWEHSITLESTAEKQAGVPYPRCIAGARNCPPEGIGGTGGYADMLEALNNSRHEEHDHFVEWIGEFDSEHFDLAKRCANMRTSRSSFR